MEILLEKDICETLVLEDILELSAEDKARVKEQVGIENIRSVDLVNIGPGADCLVLLLVVDIFLRVLKIGSEVNDGIDGWIGLGKKLMTLLRNRKIVSVDIEGATSIAIEFLAQREKIHMLEKLQETTIHLVDLSCSLPKNVGLSRKPHYYYIQAYRIYYGDIYVVGITSAGETNLIKHFGYSQWGIKEKK